MSTVASLVNDSCYFARAAATCGSPRLDVNDTSILKVKEGVQAILGADFQFSCESSIKPTGLALFDTLSTILPFSTHSSFFWTKVAFPFASMLDTANYPLSSQLSLIIFFYARILGFLGLTSGSGSTITRDGSPIEYSWVIPNRTIPKPGEPTREVRFGIQPFHPVTGIPLKGADVLDYLLSSEGGLGMIRYQSDRNEMSWMNKTEGFLFPDAPEDKIPPGSRFILAVDCATTGIMTLKAYYAPAHRSVPGLLETQPTDNSSIYCGDADMTSLRQLIPRLHPSMIDPIEKIIAYVDMVEPRLKPTFLMFGMDCLPDSMNRLKIYFVTKEGTSWSDVVSTFTLGGTFSSPSILNSMGTLEKLWNALFPNNPSSTDPTQNVDLSSRHKGVPISHSEGNSDQAISTRPLYFPGFAYYYEIAAGDTGIYPKIYWPLKWYYDSDLAISNSLEAFYNQVGVQGSVGCEKGEGWVAKEVEKAFKHRDMKDGVGCQTYVTFATKKVGWDVTTYFSPELWV